MQDYFGYDVNHVMNITDIDDKIIKRARQRYLIEKYMDEDHSAQKFIEDITAAVKFLKEKYEAETNADKRVMYENQISKIDRAAAELEDGLKNCDGARCCTAKQHLLD